MTLSSYRRSHARLLAGSLLLIWASSGCSTFGVKATSPVASTAEGISDSQNSVSVPGATSAVTAPESTAEPSPGWKVITNAGFGLTLKVPADWYGPDVYELDQGVRLAVGSDKVYPYGTDPADQTYTVKNSYYVVVQYTRNASNLSLQQFRENQPWINTYLSLLDVKNGESLTGPRDHVTRVRPLKLGRFEGLEYISTLSPAAQTDLTYIRQAVLLDEHLNALTVMGTPSNVEVPDKTKWQDAYRRVDEANVDAFDGILESIAIP